MVYSYDRFGSIAPLAGSAPVWDRPGPWGESDRAAKLADRAQQQLRVGDTDSARLSLEVRDILKATGTTAVLVTHDQHEAFAVADVVGIMRNGRIEQWASPYDLYHRPATRFVADFVGQGVFLAGEVAARDSVDVELGRLVSRLPLDCGDSCAACQRGCRMQVLLRPDDVVHDDASPQRAEVVAKAFRGAEFLYTLRLPSGAQVLSLVPSHHNHAIGERIGIRLDVDHVVAFRE